MSNPFANIDNFCFFDTETRAEPGVSPNDGNVKTAGTYRYAKRSFVIILTYAISSGPVNEVSLARFDHDWMTWANMPPDLREFYERARRGEAWFAAFNAGFDRQAWNNGTYDFPPLAPEMTIDIMAQAVASNLPPSLEGASRAVTGHGKQDDGKALINLFTRPDGPQPFERPEEWQRFLSYAVRDTGEAREVWRATRPLEPTEWEDYWESERINDRGVKLDLHFVERAAAVAEAEIARLNRELSRWTNGQITAVTQTKRIAQWVYDRLEDSEARELLVKTWKEDEAPGDDIEGDVKIETPDKLSLEKGRLEALIAYFTAKAEKHGLNSVDRLTVDVLTARQFGGGASFSKFQKMLDQHDDDGRLKGQYVFNGAAQTGRFSSKGVQIHNLTRSHLDALEEEAIEFINGLQLETGK